MSINDRVGVLNISGERGEAVEGEAEKDFQRTACKQCGFRIPCGSRLLWVMRFPFSEPQFALL